MADLPPDNVIGELLTLLDVARPMMEAKCCHFDWCIERQGVISANQAIGFHDIEDGMHPGCAPYRRWLDRVDELSA